MNLRKILLFPASALACLAWAVAATAATESAPVELREVEIGYPAEAVVEAVREATVAAQVSGRIVDVRHDAGARVRQGELLMRIDEREATQVLAESDAQLAQARANLANARANWERTRNLFRQKFVSQAALDQAEAAHRAAEAQEQAALAGRGQAGTAKSFTAITAPISGVVAERHAELGEMAAPGKALMTVFDPKGLRVVANIPQHQLAQFKGPLVARIEFPESGRWIEGRSVTILPTADTRTHVVRARVLLPEGLSGIVPGMFARAHFVSGKVTRLVVPASAVLRRGEVTAAYVLAPAGGVRLRQIRVGDSFADGSVEIVAGLAPGERVALDPVKAGLESRARGR
jgi:RND family efflux transporter MFP subunit